MNRSLVFIVAVAAAVVGGLVAAPRRYEVDGISMGPGFVPGDRVTTGRFPDLDRWRRPARFDRWIVRLPDGSTGLKRVVGLPGEAVSLSQGDLSIDGRTVLKGPRLLAEIGSGLGNAAVAGSEWSAAPVVVLDDAPFASGAGSRLLLPVRDAGFAAVVSVPAGTTRDEPVRVRAAAGPLAITWRFVRAGRYAAVAGRLDGHAVAAAWPLGDGPRTDAVGRLCLPAGAPASWDVARPWPGDATRPAAPEADAARPAFSLSVIGASPPGAVIEQVATWRDVLLRTAADGLDRWSLGTGEVFVLGDFPSGSRDSRHFGPLDRRDLRHRILP